MAISAFYIHKRSVDQVLDRLIKLRRKRPVSPPPSAGANHLYQRISDTEEFGDYPSACNQYIERGNNQDSWRVNELSKSLDNDFAYIDENGGTAVEEYEWTAVQRMSSSMPDVRISNEWADDEANLAESNCLDHDLNSISSNLPPLRTNQINGWFSVPFTFFFTYKCLVLSSYESVQVTIFTPLGRYYI